MSTTLQVPEGDMVLDLSASVNGLEGHTDDGYIDYSEDEPESSPIKVANNSSNFDANLSVGDASAFAQQVPSPGSPSTAVNTKSGVEVADSTVVPPANVDAVTNVDAALDGTSALVDNASTPTPLVAETQGENSGEDVITWEEEELEKAELQEETNIGKDMPSDDGQSEAQAHTPLSASSQTLGDADEGDGAVHVSAHDLGDDLAHDAESIPNDPATVPSPQQEDDSQHEIDYEEAAPEITESEKKQEDNEGLEAVSQLSEDHETTPDAMNEDSTPVENASDSGKREYGDESMQEFDEAGDGLEVHPAENQEDDAEIQLVESSAESLHTPEDGSVQVPAITVAWDGIEYPLFYNSPDSEDRECFFDDLGLLQCKMEELLASFRRELSNDVSDIDELVFQVDELGLEFAETSRPEEFSEITLGGILQIYDTLVKNKDPEASRPLYCYLVTRPRVAKRWHVLIEDAYQGKNIDEVSYIIQSPGQNPRHVDTTDEDPEMALMEVDDEIEDVEGEAADKSEDEAEPHDGDYGEIDTSDGLDLALEREFDDSRSNNNGEVADEDLEAVGAAETGASEPADDNVGAAASKSDDLATAQELEADVVNSSVDESKEVLEPVSAHEVSEIEQSPNPDDMQTDDVAHDGEQGVAPADDVAHDGQQGVAPADDEENTTVELAAAEPDTDSANKVNPVSNATATVNGDDEEDFGADIDLNADMARDDLDDQPLPTTQESRHDELEEIDWRDYPGQGDDEEPPHDAASVTGKRPRSQEDDTLGEGDEQDIKRQRSWT
ncbi:hypothetical protein ACRALDRAFT_2043991 [Sodiomyces alcalophilus JCM 7366]|uniref:uncharacterized protein n=1 Tax=Sodiomyces alcalophilus JCM 7366 TaxID=591952 RepID=UPI0039B6D64C